MLTIIVWSKDRACQTELCLRSIQEKLHVDKKVIVQYTATTKEFHEGFDKVYDMYGGEHTNAVQFFNENTFKDTLLEILKTVNTDYILFHTDDDVYLQDVDNIGFKPAVGVDVACMSLRMNPTINRCYPANNKEIKPPELSYNDIHMIWNWTEAEDQHCCWGYPMSVDSHIYRSKDIIPLIHEGHYNNVNSLESYLNRNRWYDKPYMLSFTETKVYNVQNNFVQGHRMNEQEYDINWLNEQFLAGKRISTKPIYGMKPTSAHGKIPYEME